MTPQAFWYCDTCGEKIENANEGWLEWISYDDAKGNRKGRNLRIVHHGRSQRCMFDKDVEYKRDKGITSDGHLDWYLGPDGMMKLLAMASEAQIPTEEVLSVIKRIHVPAYETAFRHFERAIAEGVFEPNTKPDYYHMSDIKAVNAWLAKEGEG